MKARLPWPLHQWTNKNWPAEQSAQAKVLFFKGISYLEEILNIVCSHLETKGSEEAAISVGRGRSHLATLLHRLSSELAILHFWGWRLWYSIYRSQPQSQIKCFQSIWFQWAQVRCLSCLIGVVDWGFSNDVNEKLLYCSSSVRSTQWLRHIMHNFFSFQFIKMILQWLPYL